MALTPEVMQELPTIVKRLRPELDMIMTTGDPAKPLIWNDPVLVEPTEAEIIAEWDVYRSELQQAAQDAAQREADLRTLEDAAIGLAQIAAERTQIASGLTALAAATTLAQVKPIVNAMLQGMDNIEMRQAEIIKAVSRLVRRELGEE